MGSLYKPKARSYAKSDLERILTKAAELCPGNVNAFMDIGCGTGNVLIAAATKSMAPIVGIENEQKYVDNAKKKTKESKVTTVYNKDLTKLKEADFTEIIKWKNPTIAHCYDGGILPADVVFGACSLVKALPLSSVVVFVTSMMPMLGMPDWSSDYNSPLIIERMKASNYTFLGAIHDVCEDEYTEPTLNALFFFHGEREHDFWKQAGLEPNYQREVDERFIIPIMPIFMNLNWVWFESGLVDARVHTVRPDGSGMTISEEKVSEKSKITVQVRAGEDGEDYEDLFYVEESKIWKAGRGLFAARDFKKNTIITEFLGTESSWVTEDNKEYAMTNSRGQSRTPKKNQPLRFAHFLNMAETEIGVNCEVIDIEAGVELGWKVITLRAIEAGEELLLNYRRGADDDESEGDFVEESTTKRKAPEPYLIPPERAIKRPKGSAVVQTKILARFRSLHLKSSS